MYDAAMERIIRWAPELKDRFERAAAKAKVMHKPAASLEERAAGSARKRTIEEAVEEAVPEAERRWQRRKRSMRRGGGRGSPGGGPGCPSSQRQPRVRRRLRGKFVASPGPWIPKWIVDPAPVAKKRRQCKAMQNRERCQAYTASARSEYCRACCSNLRRGYIEVARAGARWGRGGGARKRTSEQLCRFVCLKQAML